MTAPINELPGFLIGGNGEGNLKVESHNLDSGINVLAPQAAPSARNLYIDTLPNGEPTEVGPMLSPAVVASAPGTVTANRLVSLPSASDSLTSVLFELEGPTIEFGGTDYLWPRDETTENTGFETFPFGFFSLYQYTGTENLEPKLVGVDGEKKLISQCGTSLGFPREGVFTNWEADEIYNAISKDGSRVFFTASGATQGPEGNACTEAGGGRGPSADELYARVGGPKRSLFLSRRWMLQEDCAPECAEKMRIRKMGTYAARASFKGPPKMGRRRSSLPRSHWSMAMKMKRPICIWPN